MFNADINSAGDGHIVVTLSGDGVHDLTEPEIERRMSIGWQPWDTVPRDGTYFDAWVEPSKRNDVARRVAHVQFCPIFSEFHAWEPHSYEYQEIHELGTPTHWRPEPEGPKK